MSGQRFPTCPRLSFSVVPLPYLKLPSSLVSSHPWSDCLLPLLPSSRSSALLPELSFKMTDHFPTGECRRATQREAVHTALHDARLRAGLPVSLPHGHPVSCTPLLLPQPTTYPCLRMLRPPSQPATLCEQHLTFQIPFSIP